MSRTTPEQIEAEVAAQRAELAGTVDALSSKLDVKHRARTKLDEVRRAATTDSGAPRPQVWGAAGALLAVLVVAVWWRRR